jgi:hypothetical protein
VNSLYFIHIHENIIIKPIKLFLKEVKGMRKNITENLNKVQRMYDWENNN